MDVHALMKCTFQLYSHSVTPRLMAKKLLQKFYVLLINILLKSFEDITIL